jgi:hypothetical protein
MAWNVSDGSLTRGAKLDVGLRARDIRHSSSDLIRLVTAAVYAYCFFIKIANRLPSERSPMAFLPMGTHSVKKLLLAIESAHQLSPI